MSLGAADYDRWLDPTTTDAAQLQPLLDCYPAGELVDQPATTHVNIEA